MAESKQVELLIEGGSATAGPPLGPALGPLGVNVLQIVNRINELTKSYSGMKVPVKITVNVETKGFDVEVGTPTTSALIVKELTLTKGSGKPKSEIVGNLTVEQLARIASIKLGKSYASSIKGAACEILGTCISMGVTIEGKDPRVIQKEITSGQWDEKLQG